MQKVLTVLAVVFAALGIPWAAVVFLAGGMKTVPRLTLQELVSGLSLALLAVLFGVIAIWRARRAKARIPKLVLAGVVGSLLATLLLVVTYFEYR